MKGHASIGSRIPDWSPMHCLPPSALISSLPRPFRNLEFSNQRGYQQYRMMSQPAWYRNKQLLSRRKANQSPGPRQGCLEPVARRGWDHSTRPQDSSRALTQPALPCLSPVLPCSLLSKQTRHSSTSLLANTSNLAPCPRTNKHTYTLHVHV